eukprot:CAMPEP_0183832238 /NCGR_PEP_ID=MMETSP0807_2-20130328/5239_1 /TAXON_ID=88271 /ORGANISM="Picocystis salinarum, Strain CCMP1897" /LENGTH=41 /DNA_ID= /DNA_START= /DNA_END= /DNA_ORIENTATION=
MAMERRPWSGKRWRKLSTQEERHNEMDGAPILTVVRSKERE